jgi:hypothetical protein
VEGAYFIVASSEYAVMSLIDFQIHDTGLIAQLLHPNRPATTCIIPSYSEIPHFHFAGAEANVNNLVMIWGPQ